MSVHCLLCVSALIGLWLSSSRPAQAERGGSPRTFLLDLDNLALAKQLWQAGDAVIGREVEYLINRANQKLSAGPYSVVDSGIVAPSGDPHDFTS